MSDDGPTIWRHLRHPTTAEITQRGEVRLSFDKVFQSDRDEIGTVLGVVRVAADELPYSIMMMDYRLYLSFAPEDVSADDGRHFPQLAVSSLPGCMIC